MGIDLTVSGETKLTGLVGGSGITSSFPAYAYSLFCRGWC